MPSAAFIRTVVVDQSGELPSQHQSSNLHGPNSIRAAFERHLESAVETCQRMGLMPSEANPATPLAQSVEMRIMGGGVASSVLWSSRRYRDDCEPRLSAFIAAEFAPPSRKHSRRAPAPTNS